MQLNQRGPAWEMERPRSRIMASWVGEEKPLVKPNWTGPRATMSVQRSAETWDSGSTAMEEAPAAHCPRADDPNILYQLPLFFSSSGLLAVHPTSWSLPLSSPPPPFIASVAERRAWLAYATQLAPTAGWRVATRQDRRKGGSGDGGET